MTEPLDILLDLALLYRRVEEKVHALSKGTLFAPVLPDERVQGAKRENKFS